MVPKKYNRRPSFYWFNNFLDARAEIREKFLLVIWENWRQQNFLLKFSVLYVHRNDCLGTTSSSAVQFLYIGKKPETFYNIPVVQSCILDISKEFLSQRSLFCHVSTQKNDPNFKTPPSYWSSLKFGFILCMLTFRKKRLYKQETSLIDSLALFRKD